MTTDRDSLIADDARAVEDIDADELERYAAEYERGRTALAAYDAAQAVYNTAGRALYGPHPDYAAYDAALAARDAARRAYRAATED